MDSLWDIIPCDIQNYIFCISRVMSAREKWKGYNNRIAQDIYSIISLDIFSPSIQLYGIEGSKTVSAINIIKNMKTFYILPQHLNIWQHLLRDISYELWENEWVGGGQAATYNLIEQASREFYTNPKYRQIYPLDTSLNIYSYYPHMDDTYRELTLYTAFNPSDFID